MPSSADPHTSVWTDSVLFRPRTGPFLVIQVFRAEPLKDRRADPWTGPGLTLGAKSSRPGSNKVVRLPNLSLSIAIAAVDPLSLPPCDQTSCPLVDFTESTKSRERGD